MLLHSSLFLFGRSIVLFVLFLILIGAILGVVGNGADVKQARVRMVRQADVVERIRGLGRGPRTVEEYEVFHSPKEFDLGRVDLAGVEKGV